MPSAIPSESEVLGYLDQCRNWGRWGADDQRGTLNFIKAEHVRRAADLVVEGISVTCSRIIPTRVPEADFPVPPLHMMLASGDAWAGRPTPPDELQSARDFIGLAFHGFSMTHIDSLSHVFRDGQLYNGHPASLVSTADGARMHSVDVLRDGLVGRGVLLDIAATRGVPWLEPGEGVYPEDLKAAEQQAGVRVGAGDILLCRFGAAAQRHVEGPSERVFAKRAGLHATCAPWLHDRQVAALGSDSAQDMYPSGYPGLRAPMHQVGIVAMGLCLIDNCDLEELSRTCQRLNRHEFMLTIGPLRIEHGTGSPVNPIAIF